MKYNNIMPCYSGNMYQPGLTRAAVTRPGFMPGPNDRFIGPGGFLLPFALGFVSSPLIFGATRPRPYGPVYGPYPAPGYFPYY